LSTEVALSQSLMEIRILFNHLRLCSIVAMLNQSPPVFENAAVLYFSTFQLVR
jgi:hypothetical protein